MVSWDKNNPQLFSGGAKRGETLRSHDWVKDNRCHVKLKCLGFRMITQHFFPMIIFSWKASTIYFVIETRYTIEVSIHLPAYLLPENLYDCRKEHSGDAIELLNAFSHVPFDFRHQKCFVYRIYHLGVWVSSKKPWAGRLSSLSWKCAFTSSAAHWLI